MSADAATLTCPVCLHNGVFNCAVSLRERLIYVSTNKISCPVCQEEICGLDKLTIHLLSHVKLLTKKESSGIPNKSTTDHYTGNRPVEATQRKVRPSTVAKNRTTTSGSEQIKFVKIYPKLPVISLSTLPVVQTRVENKVDCVPSKKPMYEQTIKLKPTILTSDTTCNVCGLQFVDTNILKMHRCLIHNISDDSKQDITRYNCHLCPKSFKMRGSLMVHLRVAHYGFLSGNSVSDPDTKVSDEKSRTISDNKSNVLERNENKQWQCDVCRKCFTTKYFLKKHKRLHTGETPYACPQCNKTFTFQQSYHKHLLYHNDEKPHTCSFCGRAFKELSTLHNHQRIHTGEKPFSCETCGKCFRQRVSYLVHRRIHTGVMPYKCTACEKSFRYKVSQRTHKCQAQPPGTVVRQSGDLVEKLKKKNEDSNSQPNNIEKQQQNINYSDISKANAELALIGAKLSLEDTESESFSFIDDVFNQNSLSTNAFPKNCDGNKWFPHDIDNLIDSTSTSFDEDNAPSPSDILKKLCLSKEDDCFTFRPQSEGSNCDLLKNCNVFL